MPRVLSSKTQEMLADLAPFLANDLLTQGVISAFANEATRIEAAANDLNGAMFPIQAADVTLLGGRYVGRMLSLWEEMLDLPVNPPGVGVSDRRAKVLAHIRKRNSGAGSDWVAILTSIIGSIVWSYEEGPGDYQVTITTPFLPGSYSAHQVGVLARAITPAHLQILSVFEEGFIIGISLIGDPL